MRSSLFSTSDSTSVNANNCGFRAAFLRMATEQEVNDHRVALYDRCQYDRSAARLVASYMYDETKGVFDYNLPTKVLYQWLKTEFGIKATGENWYKACKMFSNYVLRK